MQYPWGPWIPDNPGPNTGTAMRIEGAVPQTGGYGPFPQLVSPDGAEALSGTPRGIRSVQKLDGSWVVIAATATTLELLQSDFTWNDLQTGRTVTAGDDVSFALIGSKLANSNTTDGLYLYDIEAGGSNTAVSGASKARALVSMKNVLFLLGSDTNPRQFKSSDIAQPTKFSGGAANGGTLEDMGPLVGGADLGNGSGLMFQEGGTRAVTFGGVAAYRIDKVVGAPGCVAERTIAADNGRVGWWAEDGLWYMAAGSGPVPIGEERINRWAETNIGRQNYKNLNGAIDTQRKLFLWRLDESRLLAMNWALSPPQFSILPASTSALARIATPAVSIDSLSGTIDSLSGTIDSFAGGAAPQLSALNANLKFASFSGPSMAALLEGGIVNNPATGLVGWATPIDDAPSGTLQIGVSDRLDQSLTWKTGSAKASSGRTPQRARGHNAGFRRNIPAGDTWTYANGVDHIQSAQGGAR